VAASAISSPCRSSTVRASLGTRFSSTASLCRAPINGGFSPRTRASTPITVERVAHEAMRRGLVVGVRLSDTSDADSLEPWTRRPSGQPPIQFSVPLPPEVRAVLAQRLFVAKGGLAPTHLNHIRRLAAFQNPEFYK